MSDEHEHTTTHQPDHHHGHGDGPRRGERRLTGRAVFLLAFAVIVAAIAFTGESLGRTSSSSPDTISVTGSGTVRGTPNTMSFNVGVQTMAASATSALEENNSQMRALEATLLRHGLTKSGLQTSDLEIYENTNNEGAITGFTVDDQLDATTHHLDQAGAALDAAAHAVGNDITLNGVTFSISNQSRLLAAARARAVQNAHLEATQIAKGAGATVGAALRVVDEENTGSSGVVYTPNSFEAAASAVPVESGTQSVNVEVKVVFALNG